MFVAVISLPSCKKIEQTHEDSGISKRMDEMAVNPNFSWETSRVVEFSLTATTTGVVYIKPVEGQSYFHKGLLSAGETYTIQATIPSSVKEVKLSLNGFTCTLPIIGNKLQYQFN